MIARRKFMQALAAAPLAAKGAADQAIAKAAGIGASGLGAAGHFGGVPAGSASSGEPSAVKVLSWLKTFGLPEHVRERMKVETRYVAFLDPDLAAKRSWSMSVKIAAQRQRNFAHKMASAERRLVTQIKQEELAKLIGWKWWF